MSKTLRHTSLNCIALATAALLAACGGGGSSTSDTSADTSTSMETALSVSANTVTVPEETATAMSATLATTQVVVAAGQVGTTYNCVGGGTAAFTASGGTVASLLNGQLDTGEVYALQYTNCRSSTGAAAIDGTMSLTVTAASAGTLSVNTRTQGITVTLNANSALPQRTLTLNGDSTLSQTVTTTGTTVVTANHWTSPLIALTSARNGVTSGLTLTNVDVSRSGTTNSGVFTGSTHSGSLTLSATLLTSAWSAGLATQGTVTYDANGVPTQGAWTITLPHNRLGLQLGAGSATVTVDNGPDGTVDHTYTFTVSALNAAAA